MPKLNIETTNQSSINLGSGVKFYTSSKAIIDNCFTSQYTINQFPAKALFD